MARKKNTRTVIGTPLTPALLKKLHAFDELPRFKQSDFDPKGNWGITYRIWTCHGYRETGNQNVGFLRIERSSDSSNETFTLDVEQQVVEADGILNIVEAHIKCLNNQLASPVQWELTSGFINTNNNTAASLLTREKGIIKENIMRVERDGRIVKRKVAEHLSCDWCLFEAVPRLEFDKKELPTFDMLEGMSLLRQDQHLSYRDVYAQKVGAKTANLCKFDQLGRGILPYEYWLDTKHRLLVVTSMNKAYISDVYARQTIKQKTEQLRKSYERMKDARRK